VEAPPRSGVAAEGLARKCGVGARAGCNVDDPQVSVSKCEELTGQRCVLFALNDEIVWRPDSQPDDQAMAPAPMDRAQLQALRDAADGGSAKAQLDLGNYYLHGIGVERDPVEARGWFMKAAEQGDGLAAYELGLIYEKGLGVERSRQEAGRWFAAGAKAGNPASVQKGKEYGVAG
jgi:TPR repeat protein